MQWRLKQTVGLHRCDQGAYWFVNTRLTVICLSKNLHQSVLMCLSERLEIVPPVVGVVQELLDRLRLKFLLETCLSVNDFLGEKFSSGQRWYQVNVHGEHAKGALVGQTDRQNLSIHLNLVAVKGRSPVDVLCAEDHRLLISSVLQDGHVQWLVELQKH